MLSIDRKTLMANKQINIQKLFSDTLTSGKSYIPVSNVFDYKRKQRHLE